MGCPKLIDLQSYMDDELSLHRRRLIGKHLEQCASCREKITMWNQSVHQMQQIFTPVEAPKVESAATRWIYLKQRRVIAAAAMVIISVGLSTLWILNGLDYREDPRDTELMREDPRETELIKEYLILHKEESGSRGGNHV